MFQIDKYQILLGTQDYKLYGTTENLAATAAAVFVGLWVYEWVAFAIYSCIGGEVFGPKRHRVILSRHTMDLTSMVIFCFMGFQGLKELGGISTSVHDLILESGKVAAIGAERSYAFSAAAQRLAVWQVAYELKNFCDSVIHNDGVVFLVHHTCTAILSVSSPSKHFLAVAHDLIFLFVSYLSCFLCVSVDGHGR
jgi:hypothetical protein